VRDVVVLMIGGCCFYLLLVACCSLWLLAFSFFSKAKSAGEIIFTFRFIESSYQVARQRCVFDFTI
jgi:hypothetical protein